MTEGKWFAVYTRPRWERKLAETLTKKKIETYCPLNKTNRAWQDRKKNFAEPLFTSCVFVYLTQPGDLVTVQQTNGFQNFIYWLGDPAIVRTEEIEAIRSFLGQYPHVTTEKTVVNNHQSVELFTEPVKLRKGNVLEIKNNAVKILLPSLGQVLIADTNKENSGLPVYADNSVLSSL